MSDKRRYFAVLKWFLFIFAAVLISVLQTTPNLFAINDIKPLLLLPFAIAAAMHEGELWGALLGMFCGLLWDFVSGAPFGAYGILFFLICVGVGLLVKFLIRNMWFNALWLNTIAAFVILAIDFYFQYVLFGYQQVSSIYQNIYFPTTLYTIIVSPLMYYLVFAIHRIKTEEEN